MMPILAFRHLLPAVSEHRQVERETDRLLHQTLAEKYIAPSPRRLRLLPYLKRHFFSILFLAVYRSVGIPAERRVFYGIINHAIRGIVTGTDNILDDECKEMLPLRLSEDGCRFRSVMHILLFDRFLFQIVREAVERGALVPDLQEELQWQIFQAMVPIGEEEATEEGGVNEILPPEEILRSVHVYKGGNLLRLAMVAPRLVEKDHQGRLERADRGVFRIGMALQVIDDLTDFYEDLRDRRHNYLASSIRYEGLPEERSLLEAARTGVDPARPGVAEACPDSAARVMRRAIGEALAGFDLLEGAGFPLTRGQALELIRYLFKLRGVGHLLELLPGSEAFSETLDTGYEA
jgi:hypothetical protein